MPSKLNYEMIDECIINNYQVKKLDEIAAVLCVSTTTVYYRIRKLKCSGIIKTHLETDTQKTLAQQRKQWAAYSNHRPYDELINQ